MIPWRVLTLLLAVVAIAAAPVSDLQPELRTLLSRELKFSRSDLADLEKGNVVTHGFGATAAGEIAAVGAVYVKARREVDELDHRVQGRVLKPLLRRLADAHDCE